jgi:protein arginine N-methyltransferase 2
MLLFQNGAIWNDLDAKDETPGCLARRLGLMGLYELFVQAGVRAELLLETLEEYGMIDDSDEFEDDDGQDDDGAAAAEDAEGGVAMAELGSGDFSERKPSIEAMSAAWRQSSRQNTSYLTNPVTFLDTSLVDASSNGVMMEWETPIMKRHAELLLPKPGLRVLNIGHGLGIIDEAFQARSPLSHHIVEAHPDVLARMKEQGWMDKPGVVVHAARWQEVLPLLKSIDEDGTVCEFDAIFFDTFAEEYKAFKEFLVDKVSVLMHDKGRFGFFHGMGADRQICYDVYTEVRSNGDTFGNIH